MPKILIKTEVKGRIQEVFNLARDIDFHQKSLKTTKEKAIAGITSGLIGHGESVTWRARHFGVFQNFTSKITEFDPPTYFVDEMVKGAFKSYRHEHFFEQIDNGTLMTDIIEYKSPLGMIGKLADCLFLAKYMKNILLKRNREIQSHFARERR